MCAYVYSSTGPLIVPPPTRSTLRAQILLIVEGIYSMEGVMVNLTKVVALKKKYKVCIRWPSLCVGGYASAVGGQKM